jgi:phenylalanyl-tRNA synthetase beta chain
LLESIWLFDVYTGPQVGAGKKSLAYALRFRAPIER